MDRIINISLIVKYIVKHWLVILLTGLIMGIAVGGIYFITHKSTVQSNSSNIEKNKEVLYNQLSEDEIERVNYALFLNNKLNEIQHYLESSILFKKDAYDINKFNIQYQIRIKDSQKYSPEERSELYNKLLVSYANYFNSGSAAMELMTRYYKNDDITQTQLDDMVDLGYDPQMVGSGTFSIAILEPSSVNNILENLQTLLSECIKNFSGKIIDHDLVVINSSSSNNRADQIADLQEKIRARYDATRNSIRLMKVNGELSDNAIAYYDAVVGKDGYHFDSEYKMDDVVSSGFSKRKVIKYALAGGLGGVFCSITLLVLYYLLFVFGKYIVSQDDFTSNMGIRYLGDLDDRKSVKLIASKIKGYCDENGISKIALMSSEDELIQDSAVKSLIKNLEDRKIQGLTVGDANADSNSLDTLFTVKHCLMIERMNYSYYGQAYSLVAMMKDNDINIIGAVGL